MIVVFSLVVTSLIGVCGSFLLIICVEKILTKEDTNDRNWFFQFVLVAIGIVLIWLGWFWLVQYMYPALDNEGGLVRPGPGVSGDMFGALTALFSGLAFAGLVVTLVMQREELDKQREELLQTRRNFESQRFEATLFGLIKLLDDYVCSIEVVPRDLYIPGDADERFRGRKVFAMMAEKIRPPAEERMYPPENDDEAAQKAVSRYETEYNLHLAPYLGPYLRLFFNVVRHIRNAELPTPKKLEYAKYLRAYLSEGEILLLAMNGISENGDEMKWPLQEFSLLRHLSPQDREIFKFLEEKYSSNAFNEYFDYSITGN